MKKKLDKRFHWTWQYALNRKYNQGWDDRESRLPNEEDIVDMLRKMELKILDWMPGIISKAASKANEDLEHDIRQMASSIHKRIKGEV